MIANGYNIGTLTNDNSGNAKWGFAVKNGVEYFVKQFLSPVYPSKSAGLSPVQIEQKTKICKDFEYKKRSFYNKLNHCITGNIVTICDFFRHENRYYMITEKVGAVKLDTAHIAQMNFEQKMLIIKVLLYNVTALHNEGIVHGDLKPTNILFQRTAANMYTAKLIDFDSSFLEEDPPKDESELQGDTVYLAPESFLFMAEEEAKVTCKIDVFALGILIHQYLTGDVPYFDRSKYNYAFEAALDGASITANLAIPEKLRELILSMLNKDPDERPSCAKVFNEIMAMYGPKLNVQSQPVSHVQTESVVNGEPTLQPEPTVQPGPSYYTAPEPTSVYPTPSTDPNGFFRQVTKL